MFCIWPSGEFFKKKTTMWASLFWKSCGGWDKPVWLLWKQFFYDYVWWKDELCSVSKKIASSTGSLQSRSVYRGLIQATKVTHCHCEKYLDEGRLFLGGGGFSFTWHNLSCQYWAIKGKKWFMKQRNATQVSQKRWHFLFILFHCTHTTLLSVVTCTSDNNKNNDKTCSCVLFLFFNLSIIIIFF